MGRFSVNYWRNIIHYFRLHRHCPVCGKVVDTNGEFCNLCSEVLPWILNPCPVCGLETPARSTVCQSCLAEPPRWHRAHALFRYETPVRQMIHALKYHAVLKHASLFGRLLTIACRHGWRQYQPDCLVPVPLHPKRLRQRGFNQAIEIARDCARQMQIPLITNAIRRAHDSPAQAGLPARRRILNIKNAFEIVQPLPCRHVVIVDDVMTTGSTVSELTRVLLQAGVETVEIRCIARAEKPVGTNDFI